MLFIADLHLSRFGDTIPGEYKSRMTGDFFKIPSRMADTLLRLKEVVDYAANTGASRTMRTGQSIVIGGDVFDSSRPPLWVVAYLCEVFSYAHSKGVDIWIIPGNHDCDVAWGPAVLGETDYNNVHYINTVRRETVDGFDVGFIPHHPRSVVEAIEKEMSWTEYVGRALGDNVDVLVSHAHLKGVRNSSDVEIEAGEAIAFDPAVYPRFGVALFGHIHKGQNIGKVWYPGSMSVCDYSEAEDEKGFLELTDLEKGPRFIEFSHEGNQYKNIRIDLMTKDAVEFPAEKVKALVGGKLVKITAFTNDPLKVDEWAIRKTFNEFGYVTRFETIINRTEAESGFDEDEPTVSYEDLFGTWVGNKGVSEELAADALPMGKTIIAGVLAKEAVDAE